VGASDWGLEGKINFQLNFKGKNLEPKFIILSDFLRIRNKNWPSEFVSGPIRFDAGIDSWKLERTELEWKKDKFTFEISGKNNPNNWKESDASFVLDGVDFLAQEDLSITEKLFQFLPVLKEKDFNHAEGDLKLTSSGVELRNVILEGPKIMARVGGKYLWNNHLDVVARIVSKENQDDQLIKKLILKGLNIATIPVAGVHIHGKIPDLKYDLDIPIPKLPLVGIIEQLLSDDNKEEAKK